jgi:hypothetical protein
MANENIVVEEKDGVITKHYYNGETPPKGIEGKLIESYDGCNITTYNENGVGFKTLVGCCFVDGQTVNTWDKYKISKTEYVVIHDSYIYCDLNIKRW